MRIFSGTVCSFLLGAIILAAGCTQIRRPPPGSPPEELMRYGWRLLEKDKTFTAKEVFQQLIYSAPGSAIIDSVHYGLAETQFKEGNYYLALNEYRQIVQSFPRSSLVDDAASKIGLCHWEQSRGFKYDQQETLQAREAWRAFLLDYPGSELVDEVVAYYGMAEDRLARKIIYQGETYLRLGTERDLEAAILAFREALQYYPETSFQDLAIWGIGEAQYRLGHLDEARQSFGALVANFPDSRRIKHARSRLKKIGPASQPPPTVPPVP